MWDKIWLLLIDEHIRFKQVSWMNDKTAQSYLHAFVETWARIFGPPVYFVSDQEGALTSDMVGTAMDRYSIKRDFAGADPNRGQHTTTGLIEGNIRMTKSIAHKNKVDAVK